MIMLNAGIRSETKSNGKLNSGDLKVCLADLVIASLLDLHSLVKAFPIYRLDSTYKDEIIHR